MEEIINLYLPWVMIGVVCLVIGGLAGFLLAGMFTPKPPGEVQRNRNLVEVLRIYRDRRNDELNIEIGGKMFKKADELTDKWRTAMLRLVDDLQMWLGVSDIATRIAAPQPAITQRQATPASLTVPAGYNTKEAENLLAAAVAMPPESTKPASLNPIDAVAKVIIPSDPVKEKGEPKSIAAQVDEILQEKLERSVLNNRYISIEELPGRGMVVIVDGQQYEGVSDVPDPAVRELLRQCVAEWEKRAGGM